MQRLTEIKNRIRSISDTRKITGAMETISVAKMQKAMAKYESSKLFFDKILETIRDITRRTGKVPGNFFKEPDEKSPAVYIVIASDKGMAGAYNSNILKHAWRLIRRERADFSVFTVGQTAREFFIKKDCPVALGFSETTFEPGKRDAAQIADTVLELFNSGRAGRVFLSYTHMYENNIMTPSTLALLPLSSELAFGAREPVSEEKALELREIRYEPSPAEVVDLLIPQYLKWVIYGALVQSSASEHFSRRLAMSSATKNANDILEDLTILYHQARQESITNELNEIITTSSGINKK